MWWPQLETLSLEPPARAPALANLQRSSTKPFAGLNKGHRAARTKHRASADVAPQLEETGAEYLVGAGAPTLTTSPGCNFITSVAAIVWSSPSLLLRWISYRN
jgi:hypothetical protein